MASKKKSEEAPAEPKELTDEMADKMTPSVRAKARSEEAASEIEKMVDEANEDQDSDEEFEPISTSAQDEQAENIQDQYLTPKELVHAESGNEFLDRLAANRAEPQNPEYASPFDGKAEVDLEADAKAQADADKAAAEEKE